MYGEEVPTAAIAVPDGLKFTRYVMLNVDARAENFVPNPVSGSNWNAPIFPLSVTATDDIEGLNAAPFT
ncbi:hypothetical protein BTA51_29045 [Hahella sp. CCB-MM4]|nr:hypothetical protein BTA51_29045 [Hahella sp. CCB-MM4]